MKLLGRKKRSLDNPWWRCERMYCDCTDIVTREKLPENIAALIHERDWHRNHHSTRSARASDLLDLEIDFLVGDCPYLQTAEDLEEQMHKTREYWADEVGRVPYEEDYRVASPNSTPLRALGALR